MFNTLITAIIVIFIMFGFSFFIFKNVIKRINDSAKRYFLEKLQEYNYLIDEKEEKLENLREELEQKEKIVGQAKLIEDAGESIFSSDLEKRLEEMKKFKEKVESKKAKEIEYDIPTPKYREETFFDTYKKLKKEFNVDNEKIIKEFIKNNSNKEDNNKYKVLSDFRKQFTDKTIYECLTLKNEEQYSIINEVMSKKVSDLINFKNRFTVPTKFVVTDLINELDDKIKECNPYVYIYVNQEDLDFSYIDKMIKTKTYRNMSEGIIIYYKGKIYDYSI